ncbi:retrovirus-related pol polyprotein from transposon TNT 1-94 [Tanacetum coccineum]
MSDTVPPIPPPFGANTGNPSNPTDTINNITTTNVVQNVGPSKIKDTKIAALRLKSNAFKALEGEKVNGTFRRLRSLLNDLENNGVSISQVEESDSDIEEDQRSSSEFLADLNAEFHERALLANQRRYYKRSRRVGSPKKPIDRVTTFKALMAVADEELSVGRANARKNLLNKYNSLKQEFFSFPGNIVKALGRKRIRKEKISSKEVVFTKFDVSTSKTSVEIPSDSESEGNTQRPLPSLPKLIGAEPSAETKPSPDSSTKKLFLTLMEEVKGLKEQEVLGLLKDICPKVVFGDKSLGDTKGYGSMNCNGITFTKGTIFNQNQEVVLIAPRRRDVYVIDMTSYNEESNAYFFAKASPSIENLNEVKVKELRSDNGTEFKNHKLEEFYDEKGISQNFSSPCTPEQNGVAERRNRTLIEAARTISIIMKRHGKIAYDVFRGRSPDISYFYMFGCPVHIHNHMDHLGKLNEIADDGFFLGYSPVAKAFRDYVSYEGHAELSHTSDLLVLNESEHLESADNLKHDEFQISILNEQTTEASPTPLIPLQITNPLTHQERWSREKHIELVNIIGEPLGGITTRSRIKDFEAASAHECLYVNFLSEIESKKLIEALKEKGWIIVMQEELNQFERNKVWILFPAPYGKTIIGTKWIYMNKMDENGVVIKNKARLVAQRFRQEKGIEYDETFAPVARLKAIRIFLAYAAYMGFMVHQMDVKSAFLNGKILEEVYVQQPPRFESSEFPNHVCKLDKALYGLKQASRALDTLVQNKFLNSAPRLTEYQAKPKESHLVAVKRIFSFVAMSSDECEYVAAAGCCAQVLWIKSQLADYDILYSNVPIFCDNTSVIAISNNPVLHSMTKHIDIREFWYTAKVEDNTITFSLLNVEKPLSFDHDIFASVIGLEYSKNYVSLPDHEAVKEAITTLGLADKKEPEMKLKDLAHSSPLRLRYFSPTWKMNINQQTIAYALCWGLDIDIARILYDDLISKLTTSGKKGKEKNICYVRYMPFVIEHLLGEEYVNKDLHPIKPYQITGATFKQSSISEVPQTSHMRKVAKLSEEDVTEDTGDKSLSGTSVHPVSQPKAKADKKLRKKKIPSSSQPKVSLSVKGQTSTTQASESQPVKATKVTADTTQSLDAYKSIEEQENQHQAADIKKADHTTEEQRDNDEFVDSGLHSIRDVPLELLNEDVEENLEAADEETNVDNISDEMRNIQASTEKPLDHLGHLQANITAFSTKVDQLESSITKKVSEIQSFLIKETMETFIEEKLPLFDTQLQQTLKAQLPELFIKPMNKELNAFNKLEANKFIHLQTELSKVIQSEIGKKVNIKVHKGMQNVTERLDSLLDSTKDNSANVFELKKAQGEQLSNDAVNTQGNQLANTTPEEEAAGTLAICTLEEITSDKDTTDDEPLMKKLKVQIPTPTPLRSIFPDSTTVPTPLRKKRKVKDIATVEEPMKQLIPLMEQGGSYPNLINLQ